MTLSTRPAGDDGAAVPDTAAHDADTGWAPHAALAIEGALPQGGAGEGAVLLLDVAGFTALTERLSDAGPDGAETLADRLNARFGPLIDTIVEGGGDIAHFAGDAVVAWWPGPPRHALPLALHCAGRLAAGAAQADELPLRIGLAAGDLWWSALGRAGAAQFVLGGAPVQRAAAAAAAGAPGQVWADAAATAALPPAVAQTLAHDPDGGEQDFIRLDPPACAAAAGPAAADASSAMAPVPPEWQPAVLRRVPRGARSWMAEFRRMTVMFVGFGDADFAAPRRLASAQALLRSIEQSVVRFEGVVHQLVCDGPGATLVAAWGVPGHAHEDDPRRAAVAAQAIEAALLEQGQRPAIGIATGRLFFGVRGNPRRREIAILGDRMNLAARLMKAAGEGVLCDEDTAAGAARWLHFEPQPPLALKGKSRPVSAARLMRHAAASASPEPVALRDAPDDARGSAAPRPVGRGPEIAILTACIDDTVAGGPALAQVVEGEPGIGKSTLLVRAAQLARERGCRVLAGAGDAVENATAYYAWRAVLSSLWPAEGGAGPLAARVQADLAREPSLNEYAPLLNDVLDLDLPETALTAQMEPQGRADALRDLIATLLRRHAAGAPLVLVLDDAHWFDTASWSLLLAMLLQLRALVLVGTRPWTPPLPLAVEQLQRSGARTMRLGAMERAEVLALVSRRLGVDSLPAAAAGLVMDKAQGNPFFSEQLVLALRDAGHLVVESGRCRLADGARLDALAVPDTVQGVVTSRIDGLALPEQRALKVASVIGRVFAMRMLREVYPFDEERGTLPAHLQHLAAADLTRLERPEPDLQYLFTHVITQQVAYGMMSVGQRRQMHRAVAEWLERHETADLSPFLPLLGWHWRRTDSPGRALVYLERAAVQALERFANEEALRFVAEARELSAEAALEVSADRRARWAWCEGEALLKLARYRESRPSVEAALALLGQPVPQGRRARVRALAVQVLRQAWRRWSGRCPGAADRDTALLVARLHQRLAEIAYWEHDIAALAHSALASLNAAEPAGVSRELQLAHHVLGFVAGLAGSSALLSRYRARARALAPAVQHLETAAFCAQLDTIYFNAQARWAELDEAAREGERLFERIGERFRWQSCMVLRAWGLAHRGRHAESRALFAEATRLVSAAGPTQVQVWCAAGDVALDLMAGAPATAAHLSLLAALAQGSLDHSDSILCHGLLARAWQLAGDAVAAEVHATRAEALIARLPPASFHTLTGNEAVVLVRLQQWVQAAADPADGSEVARARRRAERALRGLRLLALSCPVARPAWHRTNALREHLAGRPRAARRAQRRLAEVASRLDMRWPQGLPGSELAGPG